jgi:hypothetical protein
MGCLLPLILIIAGLVASALHAGDITLVGPSTPVKAGSFSMITVGGLAPSELAQATSDVQPATGITLIPATLWGGSPVLFVVVAPDAKPGKYTISTSVNSHYVAMQQAVLAGLDRSRLGLVEVRKAGVSSELVASYERILAEQGSLVVQISNAYPAKSGSCVLEVAGIPIPPPKPDPPPVTVGKRRVILIKESSEETSAISDMYVLLRKPLGEVNKYLTTKGHLLDILDPQNTKQKWLDALTAKGLTAGMVIADFESSAVIAVVEFPKSPAEFMSALKANGG